LPDHKIAEVSAMLLDSRFIEGRAAKRRPPAKQQLAPDPTTSSSSGGGGGGAQQTRSYSSCAAASTTAAGVDGSCSKVWQPLRQQRLGSVLQQMQLHSAALPVLQPRWQQQVQQQVQLQQQQQRFIHVEQAQQHIMQNSLWRFEQKCLQEQEQQQQQLCCALTDPLHPLRGGMHSYSGGSCSHDSSSSSSGGSDGRSGGVSATSHTATSSHLLGAWSLAAATRCLRGIMVLLK
jgi:hypothetical protein